MQQVEARHELGCSALSYQGHLARRHLLIHPVKPALILIALRVLTVVMLAQACICFAAGVSKSSLSSMSDEQLVVVLQETNSSRRLAAVNLLSMRYRQPGSLVIHSKYPPQEPYPANKPIPDSVVQGMFKVAMEDQEVVLRLAAADGMRSFLARTNIVSLYDRLLDSTNDSVRVRVAVILTEVLLQDGKAVSNHILATLAQCLTLSQNQSVLLQALECVGKIGFDARVLRLQIEPLEKHQLRDVRSAARKALRSIKRSDG